MTNNSLRILAIGAHADDVELGCGGTLTSYARAGHEVGVFVASNSEYGPLVGPPVRAAATARAEAERSAALLNAELIIGSSRAMHMIESDALNLEFLAIIAKFKPNVIFTHWNGDSHPDHRVVANTTLHVSRHVPSVLSYTSNIYPGLAPLEQRIFVDISASMEEKLRLIGMFGSENLRTKGEWIQQARDQARMLGRVIGVEYAEAFTVHKYLMKI